jgi:hypothetical protein
MCVNLHSNPTLLFKHRSALVGEVDGDIDAQIDLSKVHGIAIKHINHGAWKA